ncbi:hypothetical protein C122C_1695 [Leuconostoc gelidum subsp. gasicomitatum]|uniref:Uncharacterized protein n=1 Tax=Leuconostoc gasicomitatum TaxID=115778 RepID=A0ABM9V812_9LACO|nr:hypothetical protein [Leuconostoc gasicomitatum]CUW16825.1 hypothetical protein PB1E_1955 [Leuconostoc gasicomitatum]CUW17972.1 hypothetical protein C122C_1695 [Leuconostoc gasicomitatum]SOC30342.1 conserved hypothetical protein [Leuconostoc gasicomitatum]
MAVVLELQNLPNSDIIPDFLDVTLKANKTRQKVITYQYHQSF